jgi:integrase
MSLSHQGTQVRRSTGTSDRKLAEAILAKVRVSIIEGQYFDRREEKERTFAEMMDRYTKEISAQKTLGSHLRDKAALKHLLPYFGEKTLAQITPKLISAYKVKRREERVKASTVNKELGTIRHAFNVAIREWEWCRENPVFRIKLEQVHNERVRWLTEEEFENLLAYCPEWLKPVVLVARYTGLRRGNIVKLRWDQVDLFRKVILLDKTKNGDRLGIPICETLMDVFKSLGKVRHLQSNYVFAVANDAHVSGNAVGMAFKRACKKMEVEDFRFHDLRHTFASILVQRGVDLYRVQRLLGHRDGRMTQRYSHLSPENLREAVRVLDQGYHNSITVKVLGQGTNSANH